MILNEGKSMRRTYVWVLLLVCFFALGFTASSEGSKSLVVGGDHEYPPFSFLTQDGQPTGFSVELVKAIGDVLGWKPEIKLGSWADMLADLNNEKIHIVAGMLYTPERAERYAFTAPHSIASGDIFTSVGLSVANIEELRGQRVVVQENNVVYEYLAAQGLEIEFISVATTADALRLVSSGEEKYAAVLLIPGHYAIHKYQLSNVQSNNLQLIPSDYCLAVRKDNVALQLMLDEGLRIIKATGSYDEIYNKWLGVYEKQEPFNLKRYTRVLVFLIVVAVVVSTWALVLHYTIRMRTADLTRANTRLTRSREDLYYANEELRSTVQQLTATTNELIDQYGQLQFMEEELSEEKDLLRTTLLSVGEGIVVTDRFGEIIMINHVAEQLTGWGEQSAIGHLYHEVFPGEYERVVEKVIYTEQTVEIEQQSLVPCNGDSVIVASTVSPIQGLDGLVRGAVVVFRDISESVRQRKKIEFLSYYDHLTGLLNRRGFTRELERCDQSSSLPLAVIVGDVNGLKSINDAFGHAFGDELLVKTAKILQAGITAPGFVARLGGDEFAVILPETNETQAKKIIARFNTLAEKQTVQSAPVSIAFGVAVKEDMSQELQAIFNLAEKRMYLDKRLKNSSHRFLPHLEKEEPDRTDEIGAEENIMD